MMKPFFYVAVSAAFIVFSQQVAAQTQKLEARLFALPSCPVSGFNQPTEEIAGVAAALLAQVVGKAVGAGVDVLANALTREIPTTLQATERVSAWYVKDTANVFKISPNNTCIVGVVSESFGARNQNANFAELETAFKGADRRGEDFSRLEQNTRNLSRIGVVRVPVLYFELRMVTSASGGVFSVDPVFFHYPKAFGEKPFFGSAARDVLVQLDLQLPSENEPFASLKLVDVQGVADGYFSTRRFAGRRFPWLVLPSTDAAQGVKDGPTVPVNLKLLVSETAKPGTLGKIIGESLASQRQALVEAAETKTKYAISESERQSARSTAAATASTALTSYFEAYDAYVVAKKAADDAANGTPDAKQRAQLALGMRRTMLANAQSIAASQMVAAGVSFDPITLAP